MLGLADQLVGRTGFCIHPKETLRAIAKASGGQAFTAEDANRLSNIYRSLGSQLGTKNAKREVTAAFALGAIVLLLGAAAASMRLGGRLP